MPAMSPTMTEGGVASWKVKEGDSFASGDVLLEVVSLCNIFFTTPDIDSPMRRKRIKLLLT